MAEAEPRYFADFGPNDGPLRYHESPGCIGVLAGGEAGIHRVIGIAYPAGWIQDPKGGRPIATFRLEVKDQKLPGLWTCRNREYIPSE